MTEHIQITIVGLFLSVFLLALSATLFFRFLPISQNYHQRKVVMYFRVFFICVIISTGTYFVHHLVENCTRVFFNGIFYFLGFHAFNQGLLIRRVGQVRHLYNNKAFWVHLLFFVPIFFYLVFYQSGDKYLSTLFLSLNLIFIALVLAISNVSINAEKKTKGENIATVLLGVIGLGVLSSIAALYLSKSVVAYLSFAIPILALNVHIAVLCMCALLFNDNIDLHYSNSITDGLTGLYNRRYFMSQSQTILNDKEGYIGKNKSPLCAVIACDIDFFKKINDAHGHETGDKVIQAFANLIGNAVPSYAVPARIGGEEFAILVPHTSFYASEKLACSLLKKTRELEVQNEAGKAVCFTASFGIAVFDKNVAISEYLRAADQAMYAAKNNGRDRIEFYRDNLL